MGTVIKAASAAGALQYAASWVSAGRIGNTNLILEQNGTNTNLLYRVGDSGIFTAIAVSPSAAPAAGIINLVTSNNHATVGFIAYCTTGAVVKVKKITLDANGVPSIGAEEVADSGGTGTAYVTGGLDKGGQLHLFYADGRYRKRFTDASYSASTNVAGGITVAASYHSVALSPDGLTLYFGNTGTTGSGTFKLYRIPITDSIGTLGTGVTELTTTHTTAAESYQNLILVADNTNSKLWAAFPDGAVSKNLIVYSKEGSTWDAGVAAKTAIAGDNAQINGQVMSGRPYFVAVAETSLDLIVVKKDADGTYITTVLNNSIDTKYPQLPQHNGNLDKLYIYYQNKANLDILIDQSVIPNAAPNAPILDSPTGTSSAPGIVTSLTPTLDWTFSDPDAGNTQSAYQVIIYAADGVTVVKDTLKVTSADSFYNVLSTDGLAWDTVYAWKAKTWDNSDAEGPFSALTYFKPNRAPSAANLDPGSTSSTTPEPAAPTARLSWTYSDADSDPQTAYQVKIYDTLNALVHDSTKVASANAYYDIPAATLTVGTTYYWNVTVWDDNSLSGTSVNEYIVANALPGKPTLVSPVDTKRTTIRPVFDATIGDDPENNSQHFRIQLAEDTAFSVGLQERTTETATAGWEAKTTTGSFVAMPVGGVDSTYEGGTVRYTWQADLLEGKTYYWRMAAVDALTGDATGWTAYRAIRAGDTLQFKLANPVVTSAAAARIVFSAVRSLAADGTTPATLKVEVANNGNDAAPAWEDATAAFKSGNYHTFTNAAKTAADWAVDVRVTITANDSLGVIEVDAIGFSFD
jgi:hypothetical protein